MALWSYSVLVDLPAELLAEDRKTVNMTETEIGVQLGEDIARLADMRSSGDGVVSVQVLKVGRVLRATAPNIPAPLAADMIAARKERELRRASPAASEMDAGWDR